MIILDFTVMCSNVVSSSVPWCSALHANLSTDVLTFPVYTSPFHIDAFVGSQKVKTVEDSVAGDLDIFHCSENKQLVFIWKIDSTYFL